MATPDALQYRGTCGKCGARRIDAQLGLEPTPDAYVAALVAVFREVKRVLRDDGTLWINLGDSYAGQAGGAQGQNGQRATRTFTASGLGGRIADGLKPKDLCGIPWRVAFALQADGWYLRSDIIWAKPNPMPESVTDRPTKAHEYLFLLAKAERYFYDAEAIKEPVTESTIGRYAYAFNHPRGWHSDAVPISGGTAHDGITRSSPNGRNRRSVWTVATQPYPEAHFATFPPDLITPCVLAGTSERGGCSLCGAPWERVMSERQYPAHLANAKKAHGGIGNNLGGQAHQDWLSANPRTMTGWRPTCAHDAPTVPQTVLDPFAGAGTTCFVAKELGRRWIGIELNPAYIALADDRMRQEVLPFMTVTQGDLHA